MTFSAEQRLSLRTEKQLHIPMTIWVLAGMAATVVAACYLVPALVTVLKPVATTIISLSKSPAALIAAGQLLINTFIRAYN